MPLGMCFTVTNTGKLGLMVAKPPIQDSAVTTLDGDDIIGIPDVQYTNQEMVNEVTLSYDWDVVSRAFSDDTVTVIDADSQSTYDNESPIEIECKPLLATYRGDTLAPRMCRRKLRHFVNPNPTVTLRVLVTHSNINVGDVVRVDIDTLPDQRAGVIGWDKYMLVVGRRFDWSQGTLELDVIDSAYYGQRYGLIAPSGTGDHQGVTDEEREKYVFIADTTYTPPKLQGPSPDFVEYDPVLII
jgi:hypothetical protein